MKMVAIYVTIDQFDDFSIFTEVTEGRFELMNFPEKDQRVFGHSTV